MPVTTTLYTKAGAEAGSVELPDALFAAPVNTAVLHQAVVAQLAGRRTGTADTKTRGEVRGGGRKPYRQKGTGRARQGTRTAPHYARRRRGLRTASPLVRPEAAQADAATGAPGRADLQVHRRRHQVRGGPGPRRHQDPRARGLPRRAPGASGRVLVVEAGKDERLELSARNLPGVNVIRADSLNVVDILNADTLVITQPSIGTMAEVYA